MGGGNGGMAMGGESLLVMGSGSRDLAMGSGSLKSLMFPPLLIGGSLMDGDLMDGGVLLMGWGPHEWKFL